MCFTEKLGAERGTLRPIECDGSTEEYFLAVKVPSAEEQADGE